jgi:hypothetical protein
LCLTLVNILPANISQHILSTWPQFMTFVPDLTKYPLCLYLTAYTLWMAKVLETCAWPW